jgi:acyl-ACP thioesterase
VSDLPPGGVIQSTALMPAAGGRVFENTRQVRLGDANLAGRLRLDALARHLQDVATDDSADSGMSHEPMVWVVRRAAMAVTRWPRYQERVAYSTFCSGRGPHWAERRTSGRGTGGGHLEAAVLWASVDATSGRLAPLTPAFDRVWGSAAAGRMVSARLHHPAPGADAVGRPWTVRATDIDVMGHVNNAVHWEAVEDEMARSLPGRVPVAAECEYRQPIDLDCDVLQVLARTDGNTLHLWLTSRRGVHASAVVSTEPGD